MDPLILLEKAKTMGLEIFVCGDRLVVRGPSSAESLVRDLLEHKAELMSLLASTATTRTKTQALSIGDCIKWYSPAFGLRVGQIIWINQQTWLLVRYLGHPHNLTFVNARIAQRECY